MTFREKLEQEHPDCINLQQRCGCDGCPDTYGYEQKSECGVVENCRSCWDREMPMTPEEQEAHDRVKALEAERDALRDWLNER